MGTYNVLEDTAATNKSKNEKGNDVDDIGSPMPLIASGNP